MRLLGAVEELIYVSLFRRQQTMRMVPEVVAIGGERLALGEVVQRAKLVLQLLQRGQRRFPPRGVLLIWKNAGEKLDRVAQILRPDAQLVPLPDIERTQIRTGLSDAFPSARQELGGVLNDRLIAPLAERLVARPGAGLNPLGDIEQCGAKAVGTHRAGGRSISLGAGSDEGAMGLGESRIAAMSDAHRLQDIVLEHVEVARGPKLVRDPLQFGLDPLPLLVGDDFLERDDGRTQAPQADAHLV